MSRPHETATYPAAKTTTRRPSQRSTSSTPQHAIHSAQQPMKFQPKNQNQDPNHDAHLGITIRWAARTDARDQLKITKVDLVEGCCGC
jgi:hypothetical protein